MTAPPTEPAASAKRTLVAGCAVLLGLLAAVVFLSVWLWTGLTGPGVDRPGRASTPAGPDDERLTRSRREALTRELEQVERDLEFATGQARIAVDPATRQAWNERADALRSRRDEIATELGR